MSTGIFRSWFNCADHADVLLHLRIEHGPASATAQRDAAGVSGATGRKRQREERRTKAAKATPASSQHTGQNEGQPQHARVYYAHAMHLAAHSEWFKTALSSTWRQPASRGRLSNKDGVTDTRPADIRQELTVHIQTDELEAMDLLLRLMYGHEPPSFSNDRIPFLFTCLKLADQYDSTSCIELLLTHIEAVTLDGPLLRHVFEAVPPGVLDKPAYKKLLDSCRESIVDIYGDATKVIGTEQLRREFCTLPFAAVLAWAESDELRVESENCVVYLLTAWVRAAQRKSGQGVSKMQLEQLAHQVRVLHLGPAYLHHVLPKLKWFKGCSGMVWMPAVLTLQSWFKSDKSSFSQARFDDDDVDWKGPRQWVARQRQQLVKTAEEATLSWTLDSEQLQQLYIGEQCTSPTTLCIGGFHIELLARPEPHDSGGCTLALYTVLHMSQLDGAIVEWPQSAAVVLGSWNLSIKGPRRVSQGHGHSRIMLGRDLYGYRNALCNSAPTMRELLAPYLQDNKLCLEVRFTHMDRS